MGYYSVSQYLKDTYGEKIYKIALDGGFTCPNRDGTVGRGGCIFCSGMGSGDFASDRSLSITDQIEAGKKRVESKMSGGNKKSAESGMSGGGKELTRSVNCENTPSISHKYIAYFQAFTGTYAPVERLRKIYLEAVNHPDIVGISIATRPDCLSSEFGINMDDKWDDSEAGCEDGSTGAGEGIIQLLEEINHIKPVWVELGLQTVHPESIEYIRRGYENKVYDEAVRRLNSIGVHVITHVILGLPGENKEQMLDTVRYVVDTGRQALSKNGEVIADTNADPNPHPFGIKLQLLHVIKGTDLAVDYSSGLFNTLTLEEYVDIVKACIDELPSDYVIHRITGDGDKKTLIAPLWSADKKRVLNELGRVLV